MIGSIELCYNEKLLTYFYLRLVEDRSEAEDVADVRVERTGRDRRLQQLRHEAERTRRQEVEEQVSL